MPTDRQPVTDLEPSRPAEETLPKAKPEADAVQQPIGQTSPADVQITRTAEGLPASTTDGANLARDFSYTTDASGASSVSKITIGTGADQMVIEKSARQDNLWTVHRPDGSTAQLEGKITVGKDGSYTVSHTTDESASWYDKAYHSDKPSEPLVRSVTYHPDGTITTEGFPSDFKPSEGSVYRKDGRFGEYWTEPNGKKAWIDGENRVWSEVNNGIWRSKDGLLTENMDFVKKAPVKAVQMDEPTPWTRVIDGQTKELVAPAKSWRIEDGVDESGKPKYYYVEDRVFKATYEEAPGLDGQYVKGSVKARQLTAEEAQKIGSVETRAGTMPAKANDYLVTGVDGEKYIVEHDEFEMLYKRGNPTGTGAVDDFTPPAPTGPSVTRPDGQIVTPTADGETVENADHTLITVFNKKTGQSEVTALVPSDTAQDTMRTNSTPTQPGVIEKVTNSGMSYVHTSDMKPGEYRGPDGSVLQEGPKPDYTPDVQDPSSAKFSGPDYPNNPSAFPGAFPDGKLPQFTIASEGPPPVWNVIGKQTTQTAYGTEWSESDGSKFMIDSRSRVWKAGADGAWSNDYGTFKVDEQGQHWNWKDGSADWNDSDGRSWHHSPDQPAGQWRTDDGATYTEGTWQYTKRSRDDFRASELIAGIRGGTIIPGLQQPGNPAPGSEKADPSAKPGDAITPQAVSPNDVVLAPEAPMPGVFSKTANNSLAKRCSMPCTR